MLQLKRISTTSSQNHNTKSHISRLS